MDCTLVFHVFKDIYFNVIMQIQYIKLSKDVWKKLTWIHVRTWFRLSPNERERERERERAATLAYALCFDAFVDVFVNEEFKFSLWIWNSSINVSIFRLWKILFLSHDVPLASCRRDGLLWSLGTIMIIARSRLRVRDE